MKKLFILFISLTLTSCFTEPKKESTENSVEVENVKNETANDVYENTPIKPVEQGIKLTAEEELVIHQNDIVGKLNYITEYNNFKEIKASIVQLVQNREVLIISGYEFSINKVYATYLEKDYGDGFGKHRVLIECIKNQENSNCFYDTNNAQYISAFMFPMISKELAIDYVNTFNNLKK